MTSCSISLSRDRSATSLRSFAFSSSNCFSRRISGGSMPSYFFFQLKQVAWLIPALRQMSATGTPSAPCFRMNAFYAFENLDAFIILRSSQPGETTAKNSNSKRSEEHTYELQSLMSTSYAVFCLKQTIQAQHKNTT